MAASWAVGVIGVTAALVAALGAARFLLLFVTLVVPATAVVGFWRSARSRIDQVEAEIASELVVERAIRSATAGFLASVSHELTPHTERCSVRAEALAVAMEYRSSAAEIKVAVPDVILHTDPYMLRQILHILIASAVIHGGDRIAVWATDDGDDVAVSVSDDGPGPAPGVAPFERFVDLGTSAVVTPAAESGLSIARNLAELLGGTVSHRRDRTWSHFTVRLPGRAPGGMPTSVAAELPARSG